MKATSFNGSTSKKRPALRLISTKELPREDWLQIRKQGIGSSDAAAAVGLNPYKSQLELWLCGKSTRQSHGTPIFYVDLTVRSGMDMAETLQAANEFDAQRQAAGFDQAALDEAAQRGFGNGAFEDSEEDAGAVAEEFYPAEETPSPATNTPQRSAKASLAEKLDAQAQRHTQPTDHHQGAQHAPAQAEGQ
ncbi:YqaJ viral recombinase family protein [Pseudomonas aeruginosa]|uniref:YqaJ viral recombinase family protein n=1 Tax=Pseudomonas aeruginosa TaxID=287 RepID=UPI000A95F809|nr:YqaJ viral recombinase family protein [Pseudomonas aeruginosa]